MAARYAGLSNATNTVSTTVPMFVITGGTTRRLRIYDLLIGSDATPADAACKFVFRRTTVRGTATASFTPTILDPADPAAVATYDFTWSGNPTITASSDLLQIAMNQRASVRWIAAPMCELVVPAVSAAGLAMMSAVASATANYGFTTHWEE